MNLSEFYAQFHCICHTKWNKDTVIFEQSYFTLSMIQGSYSQHFYILATYNGAQ